MTDAGPLITFAGIGRLSLLRNLLSMLHVPDSVRDERLAGSGRDADRIRTAIDEGWLVVEDAVG